MRHDPLVEVEIAGVLDVANAGIDYPVSLRSKATEDERQASELATVESVGSMRGICKLQRSDGAESSCS